MFIGSDICNFLGISQSFLRQIIRLYGKFLDVNSRKPRARRFTVRDIEIIQFIIDLRETGKNHAAIEELLKEKIIKLERLDLQRQIEILENLIIRIEEKSNKDLEKLKQEILLIQQTYNKQV